MRQRKRKLSSLNQLCLTLVKLRLNLKVRDLAFRFGLFSSQTSRYITTWTSFLCHHLGEVEWMPTVQQVAAALPCAFKDSSQIPMLLLMPVRFLLRHLYICLCNLQCGANTSITILRSFQCLHSKWSDLFVAPLYVGSVSDVELTHAFGYLTQLEDNPGISIMADKGCTAQDMLKELKIDLNVPPFLEQNHQCSSQEIQEGRKISSSRIHAERATKKD